MEVPVDREPDAGSFTACQTRFLEDHRDAVFLKSRTG
jgi:hypothetical protein